MSEPTKYLFGCKYPPGFEPREATEEDLRELVAHSEWRWYRGMLTDRGRILSVDSVRGRLAPPEIEPGRVLVVPDGRAAPAEWIKEDTVIPVLSDAATAGALAVFAMNRTPEDWVGMGGMADVMNPDHWLSLGDAAVWLLRGCIFRAWGW